MIVPKHQQAKNHSLLISIPTYRSLSLELTRFEFSLSLSLYVLITLTNHAPILRLCTISITNRIVAYPRESSSTITTNLYLSPMYNWIQQPIRFRIQQPLSLSLWGASKVHCPTGTFPCASCPGICIEQWRNCDNSFDCPDKSDESSCRKLNPLHR